MTTAVLATDGTPASLHAATRAFRLIAPPHVVYVAHVTPDLDDTGAGGIEGPAVSEDELERERHDALQTASDAIRAAAAQVPEGTRVETRVLESPAAAAIVRLADEVGADVVIVGSHGRGVLSRLFLGSVSEQVVRHASCAILVVPAAEP